MPIKREDYATAVRMLQKMDERMTLEKISSRLGRTVAFLQKCLDDHPKGM